MTMNSQSPDVAAASRPAGKTYSPFWTLCVVFLALIFLQSVYLVNDFKRHAQIEMNLLQLRSAVAQAHAISQTTEAVGRELVALSGKSTEAARIIAEFKIKLNPPAETAPGK